MLVQAKLVVLALLASAYAQSRSSSATLAVPSGLTPCVVTCLSQAAAASECTTFTDLSCVCTNARFIDAATQCIQGTCTPAELQTALAAQRQECAAASLPITTTATTPTAPITFSSTTPSAPASSRASSISSRESSISSRESSAASRASSVASSLSSVTASEASGASSIFSSAAASASSALSSAASVASSAASVISTAAASLDSSAASSASLASLTSAASVSLSSLSSVISSASSVISSVGSLTGSPTGSGAGAVRFDLVGAGRAVGVAVVGAALGAGLVF